MHRRIRVEENEWGTEFDRSESNIPSNRSTHVLFIFLSFFLSFGSFNKITKPCPGVTRPNNYDDNDTKRNQWQSVFEWKLVKLFDLPLMIMFRFDECGPWKVTVNKRICQAIEWGLLLHENPLKIIISYGTRDFLCTQFCWASVKLSCIMHSSNKHIPDMAPSLEPNKLYYIEREGIESNIYQCKRITQNTEFAQVFVNAAHFIRRFTYTASGKWQRRK